MKALTIPYILYNPRIFFLTYHLNYNLLSKRFFPGSDKFITNPQIIGQGLKQLLNIPPINVCKALVVYVPPSPAHLVPYNPVRTHYPLFSRDAYSIVPICNFPKQVLTPSTESTPILSTAERNAQRGMQQPPFPTLSPADIALLQSANQHDVNIDSQATHTPSLHLQKSELYKKELNNIISEVDAFIKENGIEAFSKTELASRLLTFYQKERPDEVFMTKQELDFYTDYLVPFDRQHGVKTFGDISKNSRLKMCHTPEDYENEIERLRKVVETLGAITNVQTEKNNIIKLALDSPILVCEEGALKLTQVAYEIMRTYQKELGIQTIDQKPNVEEIMKHLTNKDWEVFHPTSEIPKDGIISTGPLLHKVVVVTLNTGQKLILAFFTSAQDSDTIKLSNTQETNPDPDEQSKQQNFRNLKSFVILDETMPSRNIDQDTTIFSHGFNQEGENVAELIQNLFYNTRDTWSSNYIQKYFNITLDVLYKLTLITYQSSLKKVEADYDNLQLELDKLSDEKREKKIDNLKSKKYQMLENQIKNKHKISLSLEQKRMLKLKKILDKIKKQQRINEENMAKKKKRDDEYEIRKKAKEAEEVVKGSKPLTAHEKRIAHQKLKEYEKSLSEQNDKLKDDK